MATPSPQQLHDALKHYFGFDKFKGNQQAIVTSLLQGHDVFVLMPTGGGKSLCYQLPALMLPGTAIIISPLIALMKNQVDAMRSFSTADSVAHFLNSSMSKAAVAEVKDDVVAGRTKLLYVAPEQLGRPETAEFLRQVPVSFYAIDEAHCISEWGHDFRTDYRNIRPLITEIGTRPVIALTATATPKVQQDIQKNLGMTNAVIYKSSFNRPNLYYEVRPKTAKCDHDIIRFIKANPGKSGIIYCLSRKKVEEVAELLRVNGIRALPYHAGLEPGVRSANQDAFLLEQADVIVATIAFGMGIDKPDVRFVIHYDMPKSLEGYYQETGRAGRDGGEGRCLTFYSAKDLRKMEKFLQAKPLAEQEIGRQLLRETAAYAETTICRRRSLLFYFGEKYEQDNCGNCDNCLNPKKRVEAKEELCALLETVSALKEKFKAEPVIDVMLGRKTYDVEAYRQDSLDVFGCAEDCDEAFLNTLIHQAIIAGYLTREAETFGLLRLTPKGREYLEHPVSFKLTEPADFSENDNDDAKAAGTCAADTELFSILKDQRRKMAKDMEVPPYVIFQDPSLEAMATTYPISIADLQNIPGVGAGKAKRYGEEFVKIIKRYVEENEIERPEELRVRSVHNKSNVSFILQAIDRQVPLDEIARARGVEFEELLDSIEGIVMAGTRINIDYYINDQIDDDIAEDIFQYFKTSQTDSLEDAFDALGDDYTEEEIRLVRIQFLSEMGN